MQRRKQRMALIGITAILGVLLIVLFGKFFWERWVLKTYVNNAYGFSIKYPSWWTYAENINGAAVIFYSPKENELDVLQESINVVVQDLSGQRISIKDYTETAINQMKVVFEDDLEVIETNPMMLGGQYGYKFVFQGKGGKGLKYWCSWTIYKNKAYQVTYTSLAKDYDKYYRYASRMVSSFRILN